MHHDNGRRAELNRRAVLKGAASCAVLGAVSSLPFVRPARAQVANSVASVEANPQVGTRLLMLGTRGGPGVDLARGQSSSAVYVDGTPYLLDCGYGTLRSLVASGAAFADVHRIFFTHLHDDHTSDLPALLSMQWTGARVDPQPTLAYGPYGTQRLVAAAVEFLAANAEIRMVDEGRDVPPGELFRGHDIVGATAPKLAYRDDKVTVTFVENLHYPVRNMTKMPHRSYAVRFDTADRVIAFSGDTAFTDNVIELADGADIFVCEVIDDSVFERMSRLAREEAEKGNEESIYRHVAETHVTPAEVGRMAKAAKVKSVVLNHQVPGPKEGTLPFPASTWIEGVRKEYRDGPVIVGQDLMVL
jgi:ribonuclease BN (tRNA processing enzyme)